MSFIPCKQDGMYKGTLFLGKTCLQGFFVCQTAVQLHSCSIYSIILDNVSHTILHKWMEWIYWKACDSQCKFKVIKFPILPVGKNLNDLLLSDKMSSQHMGSDAVSAVVLGDRSSRSCSWISGCTAIGTCYSGHRPFNVCHLYEWNRQGR